MCVLALVDPAGFEATARGACEGRIATALRGHEGFGYDPLFVPAGEERSMAELSPAEKNTISHRGRAFRQLPELVARWRASVL